ncbi:hypothetical protein ARMSODRAFT_1016043 [Armillaria solidipes]|uniref:Peptidase C14 caspase domain-containing protein n=1 Tax=Armillaria solidipes TaxID=1076256 RepID=A0A2H3BSX6_9AGAR|nr:hypothetical protein ARMSODRAFT_1016043 [Armillaria solidipes]
MATANSSSPEQPVNRDLLEEIRRLEGVENRLAHTYGMASPQGNCIDPEAVLREAERRARPPLWHLLLSLWNGTSASETDDLEALHRLRQLRESIPQQPVLSESPSSIQSNRYGVDASRFWAVLIGIDAYERQHLSGCVSDALSMKNFLIDDLGMSEERIQCLLGFHYPTPGDPLPSRDNIVRVLYSLISNQEIDPGDNILIYFAGHGASYNCAEHCLKPKCDTKSCPVKALCPLDRDTLDAGGRYVPDISDRELDALFTEISRVKGHKITFIADCCYARSFPRHPDTEMRGMHHTTHSDVNDMLRAGHERLEHFPGYQSILSDDWKPDRSSHVCLTACRDHQTARETLESGQYGGIFTKTLLRVLKSEDWKKERTYVGLACLMNQSDAQTPVVAGVHKYDRVWY